MVVLYRSVLFIHIFFGFLYLLSHSASATVAYRLRSENGPERIRALLDLSASAFTLTYISLLAMVLGGVALGFLGRWWSTGWIWTSIALLVLILVIMGLIASKHFHRVRRAVGLPYLDGYKEHPAVTPASPEELHQLLQSGRPQLITLIGLGGWAIILGLMIFKPF
jgi:MFS family permease